MPGRLPKIHLSRQNGKPAWSDECACACPTQGVAELVERQDTQTAFRHADLHQRELSPAYRLLFNPARGGDVAVLNQPAFDLWEQFGMPRRLDGLAGAEYEVAQQLVRAGLLEPTIGKIHPCCSEPDALNVWLHVTNDCNLRCSYCYVRKSDEHMSLETGMAAVDAAFRSAAHNGFRKVFLKFSGGEPTLQLDLVYQLHAYARARAAQGRLELDAVILSNGVGLDKQRLAGIQARGLRLMLSLDGVGRSHDIQRPQMNGGRTFEQTWRTLEQAVELGLKPFISVTVTEHSAAGLADLVSHLLILELPFNFNFARPVVSGKLPDSEKIIVGLQGAFARIEANPPAYNLLGSLVDRAFFSYPHDRPCDAGHAYLVIDHHGNVSSCQMVLGECITDVHAEDPLEIIRTQVGIRNPNVDQKEGCGQCQWRYMCAGGCPLATYRATGRYDVKSPNCSIYQAIFPEVLRLEGLRLMKYQDNPEIVQKTVL